MLKSLGRTLKKSMTRENLKSKIDKIVSCFELLEDYWDYIRDTLLWSNPIAFKPFCILCGFLWSSLFFNSLLSWLIFGLILSIVQYIVVIRNMDIILPYINYYSNPSHERWNEFSYNNFRRTLLIFLQLIRIQYNCIVYFKDECPFIFMLFMTIFIPLFMYTIAYIPFITLMIVAIVMAYISPLLWYHQLDITIPRYMIDKTTSKISKYFFEDNQMDYINKKDEIKLD